MKPGREYSTTKLAITTTPREWPDLYAFYERQKRLPPPDAREALERFLDLWQVGDLLSSDVLYGNGQVLKFSTVDTKEAICQLEGTRLRRESAKRIRLLS